MFIGLGINIVNSALIKGEFKPSDITGNALWLDAADSSTLTLNGSNVSQWSDKSGNNHHFTQATGTAQPTYRTAGMNGLNTLMFNDSSSVLTNNTLLSAANFSSQQATMFAVFKPNSDYMYSITSISPTVGGYWRYYDNLSYISEFRNVRVESVDLNMPTNGAAIATFVSGEAADPSGYKFLLNGIQKIAVYPNFGLPENKEMLIGYDVFSQFYNGDVAEVVIYNRALSDAERVQVENYLQAKWGTL